MPTAQTDCRRMIIGSAKPRPERADLPILASPLVPEPELLTREPLNKFRMDLFRPFLGAAGMRHFAVSIPGCHHTA